MKSRNGGMFVNKLWKFADRPRFAAWACIGVFGSGLSSVLAYGITTIGTHRGLHAWRWIFIIVGGR